VEDQQCFVVEVIASKWVLNLFRIFSLFTGQEVLFMSRAVNESPCSFSLAFDMQAYMLVAWSMMQLNSAHFLHDTWLQSHGKQSNGLCVGGRENGISIFLSILD
jgi:hypothetical protein